MRACKAHWPAAVLLAEALALLLPRGGWWSVAGVVAVAAGGGILARQGTLSALYRALQTAIGLAGVAVLALWFAGRAGPWTHSPPLWWRMEDRIVLVIAAVLAAITLLVGLMAPRTPAGMGLRAWWRWVRRAAGRLDYLGPVVLGRTVGALLSRRPAVWEGDDRFRHLLMIGAPGTGKTSTVLAQIAWQDLLRMVKGGEIGLTVFEPKGEFAAQVYEAGRSLDLRAVLVDPRRTDSAVWNPLEGDPAKVAESVRTVLETMFGRQDAFFGNVQESASRNTVLLLKALRGDNLTFMDLLEHLWNQDKLAQAVAEYDRLPDAHPQLLSYFRSIVLKNPKWQEHTLGLQVQVQDLVINRSVNRVLSGRSSFNVDAHLADGGGVLCVGTALGDLSSKMGGLFGRLLLMSLQDAIFRRPGTERTRRPHVLLVDEAPMFINPRFGELLSMGRSYRVSIALAFQDLSQLELWSQGEGGKAFAGTVLGNCQTRMIFGGGTQPDALWFSRQLGMSPEVEKTHRVDSRGGSGESRRVIERTRVSTTEIIEQAPGRAWLQLVRHGQVRPPVQIVTSRPRWPPSRPGADPAIKPIGVVPVAAVAPSRVPGIGSRRRGPSGGAPSIAAPPTGGGVRPGVYVDTETGQIVAAPDSGETAAVAGVEEVPF